MGNLREIHQVSPTFHIGVAVPIRAGRTHAVQQILDQYDTGHFYTYIAPPNADYSIPNMDHAATRISKCKSPRLIIQSGGKMWCGYDAFCEHVSTIAEYLNDAQFYVGDEEDYIDEFTVHECRLKWQRVHSGGWRPLDDFLHERFPEHHL